MKCCHVASIFSLGWGQNLLRLSGIYLGRWFREGVRISVGREMEDFCFLERHIGLLSSNGNSTEVRDQELIVTPICVVVCTLLLFFISSLKPGQKKKNAGIYSTMKSCGALHIKRIRELNVKMSG